MIETICKTCRQRYRVGTDHVCPKSAATGLLVRNASAQPTEGVKAHQPSGSTPEAAPKRGPGRPRTITDMKAYRRDNQRKRRAAAKEGK